MTIADKIRDEKLQYNIKGAATDMRYLSRSKFFMS